MRVDGEQTDRQVSQRCLFGGSRSNQKLTSVPSRPWTSQRELHSDSGRRGAGGGAGEAHQYLWRLQPGRVCRRTAVRLGQLRVPAAGFRHRGHTGEDAEKAATATRTATLQPPVAVLSLQINSPRRLPLDGCGKVVQAACGGTQVAVLNGQWPRTHLQHINC